MWRNILLAASRPISAAIITETKPFFIRGREISRDGSASITTARLLLHKFFHFQVCGLINIHRDFRKFEVVLKNQFPFGFSGP